MSTTAGGAATGAGALPAAGGTSSSSLSPWIGQYVTDMLGKAQGIAAQPYQVYQGPLTAGASNLQNKLFQGLGNLSFPSQLGQSFTGMTGQKDASGQPISVAQQYMNPYMQQVLQPQMQAMQRQADIQRNMLGAQAAKSGAFGGARAGLMGSQLNADLMRQQQQATGQAYGQAYTQGLGQFNTEQQQAQQLAQMMGGVGAAQRAIEQEGITADRNEFLEQRDYPMKQVQFLQSMLGGLPISTVSNAPAQQSGLGQLTSTVGGIGALLQSLKGLGINLGP